MFSKKIYIFILIISCLSCNNDYELVNLDSSNCSETIQRIEKKFSSRGNFIISYCNQSPKASSLLRFKDLNNIEEINKVKGELTQLLIENGFEDNNLRLPTTTTVYSPNLKLVENFESAKDISELENKKMFQFFFKENNSLKVEYSFVKINDEGLLNIEIEEKIEKELLPEKAQKLIKTFQKLSQINKPKKQLNLTEFNENEMKFFFYNTSTGSGKEYINVIAKRQYGVLKEIQNKAVKEKLSDIASFTHFAIYYRDTIVQPVFRNTGEDGSKIVEYYDPGFEKGKVFVFDINQNKFIGKMDISTSSLNDISKEKGLEDQVSSFTKTKLKEAVTKNNADFDFFDTKSFALLNYQPFN